MLDKLIDRGEQLSLNFALKCVKNEKMKAMFPVNEKFHSMNTRNEEKYKVQFANTGRLQKSSIIYMQKLLNENEKIQN